MSSQNQQVASVVPIAYPHKFDPNALESGDLFQLVHWVNGTGASIYIHWIPDEMVEQDVINIFSEYGEVDRVEFVPKFDNSRTQIGRMLFVHFNYWKNAYLSNQIASVYPEPFYMEYHSKNRYGTSKMYGLKLRINVRPIAKVEYTNSQLTDMFERLNDRVMSEMEELRKENTFLRQDIENLRAAMSMTM